MEQSEELSLLASCQAGHLEDFAHLYDHYVTPMYRFIQYRTHDRAVAEDLTSQTFLRALEKIRSFDPRRGVFRAWLYRIARNAVIDYYRSQKHTAPLPDGWDAAGDDDTAHDPSALPPELQKAIAQLSEQQREIVLLRIWDGLSYKEIAEVVGKSDNNCKVIFSRAIAAIRSSLPAEALLLLFLFPFLR
jgi:RNA polymerase sigma-70 factor (ECF subfamily)